MAFFVYIFGTVSSCSACALVSFNCCVIKIIYFDIICFSVPEKPILTLKPKDPVEEGTPVTMTCTTATTGEITYTFFKDDKEVQSSSKATYELLSPEVSQSGAYECSAKQNGNVSPLSDKQDVVIGEYNVNYLIYENKLDPIINLPQFQKL